MIYKHLKTYEQFQLNDVSKSFIKSFDYEAVLKNAKGEPILYVVDYEIIKDDGEKVTCKIKGYQYTDIKVGEDVKKGWVKVNDFTADKRTHLLHKKDFVSGSAKKKIYDLIT
jgi:hypothetical protein